MKRMMRAGNVLYATIQVTDLVVTSEGMLKDIWMDWCLPAIFATKSSALEVVWPNINYVFTNQVNKI